MLVWYQERTRRFLDTTRAVPHDGRFSRSGQRGQQIEDTIADLRLLLLSRHTKPLGSTALE